MQPGVLMVWPSRCLAKLAEKKRRKFESKLLNKVKAFVTTWRNFVARPIAFWVNFRTSLDNLERTGQNQETVVKTRRCVRNARSVPNKHSPTNNQRRRDGVTSHCYMCCKHAPKGSKLCMCSSAREIPPTRIVTVIVNIFRDTVDIIHLYASWYILSVCNYLMS